MVTDPESTEVVRRESVPEEAQDYAASPMLPATLEDGATLLPVEEMIEALDERMKRRRAFRAWLLSEMIEGLHYAVPPGCEVQFDEQGNALVWNKKARRKLPVSPRQWQPKACLYAAGADFCCKELGVRELYEPAIDLWKMSGAAVGTYVIKCTLVSRLANQPEPVVIAEGIGSFTDTGDPNRGVKMAQKCAKVAAVIHWLGLRDMFTQDPRDAVGSERPDHDAEAPTAEPRDKRQQRPVGTSPEKRKMLEDVMKQWKALHPDESKQAYLDWIRNTLRIDLAIQFKAPDLSKEQIEKLAFKIAEEAQG